MAVSLVLAVASVLAVLGGLAAFVSRRLRQQTRQLQSTEARYWALVQRSPTGVHRSRLDGRLQDCNDAYARLLGYTSREDCLARIVTGTHISPEHRAPLVAELTRTGHLSNVET